MTSNHTSVNDLEIEPVFLLLLFCAQAAEAIRGTRLVQLFMLLTA